MGLYGGLMVLVERGRPREFDENAVLLKATEVFWAHGVGGATTRILERELGMKQSSMYNAFGSKEGLLHRSLDDYLRRVDEVLVDPIRTTDTGEPEILRFIDDLVQWISHPVHPGCLMLNLAVSERGDAKIAARAGEYRNELRAAFVCALGDRPNANSTAEQLLAGVLGLNLVAAARANAEELHTMADALKQLL